MTAATSHITQKPSRDYLVSMEPAELLVNKRNDFFELIERIPEFNKVYLQFI